MRLIRILIVPLLLAASNFATAGTVSTSFSTADGFVTGDLGDVMLTSDNGLLTATFSGGQQQQGFDGPSYNAGPDAYLFINGTFTGTTGNSATGTNDIGTIDFNIGVDEVSFFAADRANGVPTFSILGVDDTTVLFTDSITATSNTDAGAEFTFTSAGLGAQIGSIVFDNAGPAANPPYVIAIDSFSATAVPEPSSLLVIGSLLGAGILRRRRR